MESYVKMYGSLKTAEKSLDHKFEDAEKEREDKEVASEDDSNETEDSFMEQAEKDSKKEVARKTERFMSTVSRGLQDVNNPDMLRRSFILRRGQGRSRLWTQLVDPVTGFKFYKNRVNYTFQWERPESWDDESDEGAGDNQPGGGGGLRRSSRSRGQEGGGGDAGHPPAGGGNASTPQKIVIGIVGRNTKQQQKSLAKTRLEVSRYNPVEGDENLLFNSPLTGQGNGISTNGGFQNTLANLLERASGTGQPSMRFNYNASKNEEGWLRDTVMDMYLDTQKVQGKKKSKQRIISILPPRADAEKRMHYAGTAGGEQMGSDKGNYFSWCCRELKKITESLAPKQQGGGKNFSKSYDERKENYVDLVSSAMRYFDALPTTSTPRHMLKMRRRRGSSAAPLGKASEKNVREKAKNSFELPFSHPKIHELDSSIAAIVAFAKLNASEDLVTRRDIEILMSCRGCSAFAKAQRFSPASSFYHLNQARDRLQSYAVPGSSSVVRFMQSSSEQFIAKSSIIHHPSSIISLAVPVVMLLRRFAPTRHLACLPAAPSAWFNCEIVAWT